MHSIAAASPLDPAMAMDGLAKAMDLQALDTATDVQLVALFDRVTDKPMRQSLLRAYLGFAFYDITVLPLLQGDGLDEFDEIKVDRISPADATTLRARAGDNGVDASSVLKGTQLNSFGAFFCRAYRENDYLWGRLHGAERMIDIVASTLPDDKALPSARLALLKLKAFRAILDGERTALANIPDLIAALDSEIAALRVAAGA
jgi:hypothetical protein